MVLHLLGKKSWNVYGHENIERVRRDEAEARAREEAEEQRMQEADSLRRIAILRGEEPPALPHSAEEQPESIEKRKRDRGDGLPRKRRRLRGEDDTDRDLRYAQEDAEAGKKARQELLKPGDDHDAPLTDHAGHVQLIPAPDEKAIRKAEKNAEVEAEKAKKRKRDEDQYMMRFNNAAGYDKNMQTPWYSVSKIPTAEDGASKAVVLSNVQDKDVWGNADPLRKERERTRITSSDPFAAMQHAQRQLKQSERDKESWEKQRMAEVDSLKRDEERRRWQKKERRRRHEEVEEEHEDSLEGFRLDAPAVSKRERSDHDRHRKRRHEHHHRRRSHSRSKHTSSVLHG